MTVIAMWLGSEVRRRWRSLTVLALLIALAAGTIMSALAGARRGASVQERLNARTLPADAMILANTPGFDWRPIERLPEVASLTTFVVDYDITAVGFPVEALSFPPADDRYLRTIERPVIFEGRALNPQRADEALMTRQFATRQHKRVGDTVNIILASPEEVVDGAGTGPGGAFSGPRITVQIVGVGETSSRWGGVDYPGGQGGILLSPGLYAQHRENVVGPLGAPNYINALVRLRSGEAAIPQLIRDVARITGRSDIEVSNLVAGERDAQRHIAFESRGLTAFAAAAFLAALFLIGQAIARYAAASSDELHTLRALGMTPAVAMCAASAGPTLAGLVGALTGVVGAVVVSMWLPYGTAGLMEPSPGMSWDWVVLGPGLIVVLLLVGGGTARVAWSAVAAARRERVARGSVVAFAAGRSGLPVPVVIGTRFALEAGRGRTSVPVRPALAGAVTGVLGVVAAFTFSQGVGDAVSHPERFGQTFQLVSFVGINGQDFGPVPALLSALRGNPDVAGVDDARTAVATGPDGHGSVSLWAYSPEPKAIPLVILSGRAPETADEVVLAPKTLAALGAHVGAHIELTGSTKRPVPLTIVGSGLVPAGPHNGHADGGWVTQGGYDALFTDFKFHLVLVTVQPDARTADAGAMVTAAVVKAHPELSGMGLAPPEPIGEVGMLREVRQLPILLGAFLVLLAVGAVGHAIATAVRRRSRDLAVLRALGMTQSQCRWVVVTQASLLALVGLLCGVPVGLAVGRSIWRAVADDTPIAYVSPTALWVLALVGPTALAVANLLAAWPARQATRLRIAHVLRAE